MKRGILIFLGILVGVALAILIGMVLYIKNLEGTVEDPAPIENPIQFLPLRDIQLTAQGAELKGWMLKQESADPLMIIIPDYREHLSAWYQFFSTIYDWKYNVIGFNLRGHNGNSGKFTPRWLFKDMETIARYMTQLGGVEKRYALIGHGLGSMLAIQMLCYMPGVNFVLLEDAIPSYAHFVALKLWKETNIPVSVSLPVVQYLIQYIYGMPNGMEPDWSCLQKFRQSSIRYILLDSDTHPDELSLAFYRNLQEPKELHHVRVTSTRCFSEKDVKEYYGQLEELLKKYFPRQEERLVVDH